MTRIHRTAVPGEMPQPTDEGKDLGITVDAQQNFPGDMKPAIEVPEMSHEDLVRTILVLQAQIAATNVKLAEKVAAGETDAKPVFSLADAKRMAGEQLARGEVPTPFLTKDGIYVHDKAFASAEEIEAHNDKAEAAAARKKAKAV